LAIFSVTTFIMGIVIIILGVKLKSSEIFKSAQSDTTVKSIGDAAFYIMIIFACLAVVIGILGLITAKCNKCFCLGCFGFWSFIVAGLFLVAGIILFVVGASSTKMINDFCSGNMQYSEYFSGTISDIDMAMGNTTGTYMCTQQFCPCQPDLNRTKWTNETRANQFNRTTFVVSTNAKYAPFYTALPTANYYYNFYDCYNAMKNTNQAQN